MSATRLGTTLTGRLQAAAAAPWFTTAVVVAADPLVLDLNGAQVPAAALNARPTVGQVVLVGLLRGEAAVGYVAFGALVTPPPPEADYAWLHTLNPPRALSTDDQIYVLNPDGNVYCYAKYQTIHVDEDVPTDPANVVEVYGAVTYPPDPATLDPMTLDIWIEAPDGSLYLLWAEDDDPSWPASTELEVSARFPYTGTAAGYWQMWVCENPAFTNSGALLHDFALAFTREGGLPL